MANYDPDKEMFDSVKDGIKNLTDILTKWQQKETAMHSMAEVHAKESGANPEHMDAHVYMHKKAIKKAMAEQAKNAEQQGVPTAQDMPGGPTSTGVPGPQGSQGSSQGGQGGPGVSYGGSQPNPQFSNSSQGRPVGQTLGMVPKPHIPMAGQAQNTGANGWEGLLKPSSVPTQAQIQEGAPTQSVGPTTAAQRPMPGMPTPPVPAGFTGPGAMRPKQSRFPQLPSAQPPLTRPMR